MFVFGLISLIIAVYSKITTPQLDLKAQQTLDQAESDAKWSRIEERMQWNAEINEKKFAEMQVNYKEATKTAQNHIHTIDMKCDKTLEAVNSLAIQVGKLATIIEERSPKR